MNHTYFEEVISSSWQLLMQVLLSQTVKFGEERETKIAKMVKMNNSILMSVNKSFPPQN